MGPPAAFHESSLAIDRRRAVGIVDVQLQDELRRAERAGELGVPAADDVVHAVAQHDAQGVAALDDLLGHVVGAVKARSCGSWSSRARARNRQPSAR